MIGCSSDDRSSVDDAPRYAFQNLDGQADFVGDEACFSCHEDQYRGFQEHGMANSMYRLTAETAEEAFGSVVELGRRRQFNSEAYDEQGRH